MTNGCVFVFLSARRDGKQVSFQRCGSGPKPVGFAFRLKISIVADSLRAAPQ